MEVVMRRFIGLAFLLAVGFIFIGGCGEEEILKDINPYAVVLGDENAGGYVVLQGINCFPIGLYIHIDYDTLPFGDGVISSDEPALLNLTPGQHHLTVKSNGAIVAKDKDDKPVSKVYLRWEKEIVAEADYAPIVFLYCDSAILDSVPWIDDKYEPNDRRQAAYDLSGDMNRALELINGRGKQWDDDWYKITVDSYELLVEITCDFEDMFGNIDMQLIDISDSVLCTSNSDDDDEFISWIVPSSGIYYIKIYGADSGNDYDLLWKGIQPPD